MQIAHLLQDTLSFDTKRTGAILTAEMSDAIRKGELDKVRVLLQQGADPDAADRTSGNSALHFAVINGHAEIVKVLLSAGADPDVTNISNSTPLMYAAGQNKVDIALMLLEKGARLDIMDNSGYTALQYAKGDLLAKMIEIKKGKQ
jgi:ankyrin repeat protein